MVSGKNITRQSLLGGLLASYVNLKKSLGADSNLITELEFYRQGDVYIIILYFKDYFGSGFDFTGEIFRDFFDCLSQIFLILKVLVKQNFGKVRQEDRKSQPSFISEVEKISGCLWLLHQQISIFSIFL
ncbi:MAG: hypothetical protein AAGJ08_27950 [Cyanobacteria bacterium P01_H01_bin.35]